MQRVYDGSKQCGIGACPVADFDSEKDTVTIYDPQAPKDGTFTMSVEAWNALLANAKPIPTT